MSLRRWKTKFRGGAQESPYPSGSSVLHSPPLKCRVTAPPGAAPAAGVFGWRTTGLHRASRETPQASSRHRPRFDHGVRPSAM